MPRRNFDWSKWTTPYANMECIYFLCGMYEMMMRHVLKMTCDIVRNDMWQLSWQLCLDAPIDVAHDGWLNESMW